MLGLDLVLASHLLLSASAGTPAVSCPMQERAQINVTWNSSDVKFNFSQSQKQLERKHIDTVNPYGTQVVTDVGGLMSGSIAVKSNVQVSTMRYPALKLTCLWVQRIDIAMNIDPTIFIASEHPRGSCEHNAIMGHEMKHVAVDRQIAAEYMPKIKQRLFNALQKVGVVGPKPLSSEGQYQQKIMDYLTQEVRKTTDEMYAERKKRQQAVDNLGEYERVAHVCPK